MTLIINSNSAGQGGVPSEPLSFSTSARAFLKKKITGDEEIQANKAIVSSVAAIILGSVGLLGIVLLSPMAVTPLCIFLLATSWTTAILSSFIVGFLAIVGPDKNLHTTLSRLIGHPIVSKWTFQEAFSEEAATINVDGVFWKYYEECLSEWNRPIAVRTIVSQSFQQTQPAFNFDPIASIIADYDTPVFVDTP